MSEFEARMARRIAALERVERSDLRPFEALSEYRKVINAMRFDFDSLVNDPHEEHR